MRRLASTITAMTIALTACAGEDAPEVGSDAPDDSTQVEDTEDGDDTEVEAESEATDEGTDDAATDDGAEGDEPQDEATDGSDEQTTDAGTAAAPDPELLDDPCAGMEGREDEAFIELVAPVDEQRVDDEVELVGCASVFEGTVQYRLLDGDGATLDEGFTTAECGGPCLGEFRETVALDEAAGEPVVHVQVYWEDASDGSERGLVERVVVPE